MTRECGECTKCCEGYLHGETDLVMKNGKTFKLGGAPCPIVQLGKGCGDYENRPETPCRGFRCEWLRQPDVYPDEMRPDRIHAIFSLQEVDGKMHWFGNKEFIEVMNKHRQENLK